MIKIVTITVIIGTVSISICTCCGDGWLNRKVIFWLKLTQWTKKSCCILEITYNCSENQQGKRKKRGSGCSTEGKHIKEFLLRMCLEKTLTKFKSRSYCYSILRSWRAQQIISSNLTSLGRVDLVPYTG